jgi:hypothetical protein
MFAFLSKVFVIWLCGIRVLDDCESGSLLLGLGMNLSSWDFVVTPGYPTMQ